MSEADMRSPEPIQEEERKLENVLGATATALMFAPVVAIEISARGLEKGTRFLRALIKPENQPPDIPWPTPPERIRELKKQGYTDEQIGHMERFSKKRADLKS